MFRFVVLLAVMAVASGFMSTGVQRSTRYQRSKHPSAYHHLLNSCKFLTVFLIFLLNNTYRIALAMKSNVSGETLDV